MTQHETAICAVHPNQPAFATCARCGSYACSYCLGPRDVCAACVVREQGDVVPWERRDLPLLTRWWRTTRDAISQPHHFFGELRASSTGAAFGYAAAVPFSLAVTVLLPIGLCCFAFVTLYPAQRPEDQNVGALGICYLVAPLTLAPIWGLATVLLRTTLFHVAAKVVGGSAGFDASLRACAYMSAFLYVTAGASVLGLVPILGTLVVVAVLLLELVWSGAVLGVVARERHGLTGGRAAFAAWLPSAVVALLFVGVAIVIFFGPSLSSGAPDSY